MGKYFGTDGFRGEANLRLTAVHAYQIGRFLGAYFGKEHRARIVIGKDTRRSGDMLEAALCAGLTSSGADAFLLQVTTTPNVAFAVRSESFDCGIMISASHNPFYDNGIKIMNALGQKLEAAVEAEIERYLDTQQPELPTAEREAIGRVIPFAEGKTAYMQYLQGIPACSFAGKRIGLDCANGSASAIAGEIFRALGAEPYVIHHQPDGSNINRDCGSTHPEALCRLVKEQKLDAGFAYDGDADRCLAVDENGTVVDGDRILYLCGKHLMEQGRLKDQTIVTTVMSNLGLYQACERIGIRCEQTAVGDKYVCENMMANGYQLGGEQSGHIIFREYATTGDGILTSLMILSTMLETGRSLGALAGEVHILPQLLKNVRVADKKEAQENPRVQEAIRAAAEALGKDGRILVRESGTEPVIRVMAEAGTDALCEQYVNQILAAIRAEGLER